MSAPDTDRSDHGYWQLYFRPQPVICCVQLGFCGVQGFSSRLKQKSFAGTV